MTDITKARALAEGARDRIASHFKMNEVTVEGAPFMTLKNSRTSKPSFEYRDKERP